MSDEPESPVSAVRLDDTHLVLTIDCPTHEAQMGKAVLIATVRTLQLQ